MKMCPTCRNAVPFAYRGLCRDCERQFNTPIEPTIGNLDRSQALPAQPQYGRTWRSRPSHQHWVRRKELAE